MKIQMVVDLGDNKLLTVGEYTTTILGVPRIGERIVLFLHHIPHLNPPETTYWRVSDVTHGAKNTLKTEDWMFPHQYGEEHNSVLLTVTPDSEVSIAYVKRLEQARTIGEVK